MAAAQSILATAPTNSSISVYLHTKATCSLIAFPLNSISSLFLLSLLVVSEVFRYRYFWFFLFDLMANLNTNRIPTKCPNFLYVTSAYWLVIAYYRDLYKISDLRPNSTTEINGKYMENGFLKRLFYVCKCSLNPSYNHS